MSPTFKVPTSEIDDLVENALTALAAYDPFTQEQIDHIVKRHPWLPCSGMRSTASPGR